MSSMVASESGGQGGFFERMRRRLYTDLGGSFQQELDRLIKDAHQRAKDDIQLVLDKGVAYSEERVRVTIDELARPLREAEQRALEGFSEELIKQRSQQLEAQVTATLQDMDRSFAERLQKLQTQVEQEAASASERTRGAADTEIDKAKAAAAQATAMVNVTLEEGVNKLKTFDQQLAALLDGAAEKHRTRLGELTNAGLEEFRRRHEDMLRSLQEGMGARLERSFEKATEDFVNRLHSRGQAVADAWADRLQKQTQDASARLREQMEASARAVVERAQRDLATADSTGELFRRHAEEAVEAFRSGLQKTLQEYGETGTRELELHLSAMERRHEAVRDQLRSEIDDLGGRAVAEIKTRLDQVSKEALDTVYRHIGAATVAMRDLSDQTKTRVEASLYTSLDDVRAQVERKAGSNLEELKKRSESVVDSLREQLQKAVRALETGTGTRPSSQVPSQDRTVGGSSQR